MLSIESKPKLRDIVIKYFGEDYTSKATIINVDDVEQGKCFLLLIDLGTWRTIRENGIITHAIHSKKWSIGGSSLVCYGTTKEE